MPAVAKDKRRLTMAFAMFLVVVGCVLAIVQFRGPPVRPKNASATEFSAACAMVHVAVIAWVPHPTEPEAEESGSCKRPVPGCARKTRTAPE